MDSLTSLQAAWIAVHALGLALACLVRIYAHTAIEGGVQALYLCNLAGVAVAALAGQQLHWPGWTASGITLGAMIVIAVAEGASRGETHG